LTASAAARSTDPKVRNLHRVIGDSMGRSVRRRIWHIRLTLTPTPIPPADSRPVALAAQPDPNLSFSLTPGPLPGCALRLVGDARPRTVDRYRVVVPAALGLQYYAGCVCRVAFSPLRVG